MLTKRADMWVNDVPAVTDGEIIGYEIIGLPAGNAAYLRRYQHQGWQLLFSDGEDQSQSLGYFDTPDAALMFLQKTDAKGTD